MEDFMKQALDALAPLLLALLSLLAALAARWMNAHVSNLYLRGALLRLDDAVLAIVQELAQTTVADIRDAVGNDGKLTEEEIVEIKSTALERLKEYLGKKGLDELKRVFDGAALERIMAAKIEAAVLSTKPSAQALNVLSAKLDLTEDEEEKP